MASVKVALEGFQEEPINQDDIEKKSDLKDFIFLPFQLYWQIIITVVTFITFYINVGMYGFFHGTQPLIVNIIYYVIEFAYLFDVTMTIMHRNMPEFRQKRHYYPMPLIIITIDIISLLPINELVLLIYFDVKEYEGCRETWLKVLLRVFHLVYNYTLQRKQAGLNHILLITITTLFQYGFITLISSVIFDFIPYWVGGNMTWHHYLFDHRFNIDSGLDNFTLAYTTMGNIYMHNWTGIIRGENAEERLMVCLLMLVGYLWHVMIYSGQLTAAILHALQKQFRYATRLRHIKFVLNDWGIVEEWHDRTLNYYRQLWDKRHGMLNWPKSFNLVSPCLQKEVTVDIFWEALRHSHLFAGIDMAFKRELTLLMKNDFLTAGDYLYNEGDLKTKMVLSDEDLESSIVSFSAGTVLSEISCLMPLKAIANYRAATYCDIQTISYHSLMMTLRKYRNRRKYLAELLEHRLSNARLMQKIVKQRLFGLFHYTADEHGTSIKRLKSCWRRLMKSSVVAKKFDNKVMNNSANMMFCSAYLDLLVLSKKVELNVQAICLQGKCPCVIDPDSSFCEAINYIMLIAFLYQAFRIPFLVAFIKKISAHEFSVLLILDVLNYFDLFLQMITAIKVNNRVISNPAKLAVMNLKRFSFIVDILATLPFDYFSRGFGLGDSQIIATYLKLPRVIRVYRVFTMIMKKENNLKTNQILIRCTKYIIFHILAIYQFACVLFVMSCLSEECSQSGWMIHNYKLTNRNQTSARYLDRSLIYSISVFLGVSHSVAFPYDVKDMWAYHFVAAFGYFVFSFCLAELTAVTVCENDARHRYAENYQMLKQYMIVNHIKEELQTKALKFFYFQWHFNEAIETTGPRGILNDSSAVIQARVIKDRMFDCLHKVELFSDCPKQVINELANKCSLKVMPNGSNVSSAGEYSVFLNFIMRGFCEFKSHLKNEADVSTQIITIGDSFPLFSIMHRVPSFVDIYASTDVEILYISRRDLMSVMKRHINYFGSVFDTITWHYDEFSTIFTNAKYEVKNRNSRIRKDEFYHSTRKVKKNFYQSKALMGNPFSMVEYKAAFKNYGLCSFTRFLFIPWGINPYGRFYFYYEIFRCTSGVIQCILAILSTNILYPEPYTYIIMRTMFIINVIDMYIRMHCHYYNNQGILVKHPLLTSKYYCQTSLAIDVYATLPITVIGFGYIFPKSKRVAGLGLSYLITKPAEMYRLILALHHLAQKYEGTVSYWLNLTKVMVIVITVVGLCVAMLYVMSCFLGYEKKLVCEPKNWVMEQNIKADTIAQYMLVCLYITVTYFSTAFQGVAPVKQASISRYLKALMACIFITRFYMLSYISGAGVGMNAKLTEYRIRIKRFVAFAQSQNVKPELTKQICEDYQYNWEQGADIQADILNKFNNTLILDFCEFMFTKTSSFSTIFENVDADYIRCLGTNFKLKHYKKDSIIIQANDIQRDLYFVTKGRVQITIADIDVKTLHVGGIFGCFNKRGETRQTILAVAMVHVDLLVIDSSLFHELATDDPTMQSFAKKASKLNCEFFEAKDNHLKYEDSSMALSLGSSKDNSKFSIGSLYRFINKIINQQSAWFIYMDYFMFVHLAPLFCIIYLLYFYILHATLDLPLDYFEQAIITISDCIFISRIILNYFLLYIDPETGIIVMNPSKIRKSFWLDLLSQLPTVNILHLCDLSHFYIRVATGNRGLRFLYLIRYYFRQNRKLNISRHLRWTYLLYISTFQIMFLATLWRLVACPDFNCPFQAHASHNAPTIISTNYFESLAIILTYTVNMFTATGLRIMAPRQTMNMVLSTIMAICSLHTIALLLSGFVSILVVNNFSMSRYERQIDDLKIYLQDRELSPQLQSHIWSHLTQLWYLHQGEHIPHLVLNTPKFLREQLYKELYGHHIRKNFFFRNTHVDFVRQLLLHLKRTIYFPGYVIVESGDINECMYFIHKGQVQKCKKTFKDPNNVLNTFVASRQETSLRKPSANTNKEIEILKAGASFGEAQGFFNIPYASTYTAMSNVELLTLKQSDWNYLLRWFPASLEELKDRTKERGLMQKAAQSPIEATGISSMANIFKYNAVYH